MAAAGRLLFGGRGEVAFWRPWTAYTGGCFLLMTMESLFFVGRVGDLEVEANRHSDETKGHSKNDESESFACFY